MVSAPPGSSYDSFTKGGASTNSWELEYGVDSNLRVTDMVGDTDGDALPDWWEWDYYASRTAAAPGGDNDGDSSTNAAEYVAGTDPWNPTSRLVMTELVLNVNTVRVSWTSVEGRQYQLMTSSDLTNWFPAFSPWAANPPTNTLLFFYSPYAPTQQFYRIRAEYP
jgi:hypothetical protein